MIIAFVDFIIFYLTFSFQRGTLMIARSYTANHSEIVDIQAAISPTWIGVLAIMNYLTLAIALFLLWQIMWWYSLLYLLLRFILPGVMPIFTQYWIKVIKKSKSYKALVRKLA